MHVHLLQHAPHQGPARLADWLTSMGHSHTVFHLDAGELPPKPGDGDALVLLDGPEGPLDETRQPWLRRERKLVERALDDLKTFKHVEAPKEINVGRCWASATALA